MRLPVATPAGKTRRFGAASFSIALALLSAGCREAPLSNDTSCEFGEPALPRLHAPASTCGSLLPPILPRLPGESWSAAGQRARRALVESTDLAGYAFEDVQARSADRRGVFLAATQAIGLETLRFSGACPAGHRFSTRIGPMVVGPDPAEGKAEGAQGIFFTIAHRCDPMTAPPPAEGDRTAPHDRTDF